MPTWLIIVWIVIVVLVITYRCYRSWKWVTAPPQRSELPVKYPRKILDLGDGFYGISGEPDWKHPDKMLTEKVAQELDRVDPRPERRPGAPAMPPAPSGIPSETKQKIDEFYQTQKYADDRIRAIHGLPSEQYEVTDGYGHVIRIYTG